MKEGREPASFRDPSSFVFWRGGAVYRQIHASYREHYDLLLKSGLYDELVTARLLVPHEEVAPEAVGISDAALVLKPEIVPFISYPYEWCFSQLQDAALTTLDIQKRALDRGLTLKDGSAFNVQFTEGGPILIDTVSFERHREGSPWVAYRQFCQHFLAPLYLMARSHIGLGALSRHYLDGVPLDLASALLRASTWLRFGALLHVHLHALSLRRFAHTSLRDSRLNRPVTRRALRGLLESLESAVRGLAWRPRGTEWANYARQHNYNTQALGEKTRLVGELLRLSAPRVVWDLGANTGAFSRLAAEAGARVIALDMDAGAVELHYRELRRRGERRVLPLVMDLVNPSPALGWAHTERMSLRERAQADLVLALALVHHLSIANNVPLHQVARFLAGLGRDLIVEFVPKSDSQVQRLLGSRDDIFVDYTQQGFEAAFGTVYRIVRSAPIAGSDRRLYLMTRR